jgi:hypothetical protein
MVLHEPLDTILDEFTTVLGPVGRNERRIFLCKELGTSRSVRRLDIVRFHRHLLVNQMRKEYSQYLFLYLFNIRLLVGSESAR